ncbi:MAG: carbohydrate binding family 9 domain-containing protein, partial [Crocinitomicaceae bacterium]|nr:carbohydrate binding family 9 domain-containing protein [Crocinitomicaceae bacterium]
SEIHVFYDDNAIYFGGNLYDPNPDSVSYTMSQRDDEGNADWFGVSLDPYANSVNAFAFMVTAAGVEVDGLESSNNMDNSWNAVWKSAVAQTDFGWSFEIRIPYSAVRFPNKPVQEWKMNFWRQVRRIREMSHWNPIDPQVYGAITQSGYLKGLKDIKSPLRLSITPYATAYLENSFDEASGLQTWKSRATYGMDLKYGLNDAFTLDMTLIPDFGQTTSDKQVLNLGPFEVRYNENRHFFIEGTNLFKIGNVFYSRRIGATPYNYYGAIDGVGTNETLTSSPDAAPLINGTKVSGRTKKGLGIGIFNAVEGRTSATILDSNGVERMESTNPLTNYNVFVLSQNLKNNSTVSFVNTNVTREGDARNANVTVGQVNLFSKNGVYKISSTVKASNVIEEDVTNGHSFTARFSKVAGQIQYDFGYWEESDTYNPNDLGFLYNNNERGYSGGISWKDFKGTNNFYRRDVRIGWWYAELYKPQLYSSTQFNWRVGALHKKQLYANISGDVNPFGSVNHFESRDFGREVRFQPSMQLRTFFTSDYSKRFALDGRFWFKTFLGTGQHGKGLFLSPRFRMSDRWNLVVKINLDFFNEDYGYVSPEETGYEDQVILGVRDRVVVENTIESQFVFTKRMGMDLRLRHYWQQVDYSSFRLLMDDGWTEPSTYSPVDSEGESVHSTNYNAFTVDLNYRWIFIPGSELRVVYKNNLFHSKSDLDLNYFRTFESLFDQPQVNSISMKLLVYLDAIYLRNLKKKRSEVI